MLLLKGLRKIYKKLIGHPKFIYFNKQPPMFREEGSAKLLYSILLNPAPCMISRFGIYELRAVYYHKISSKGFFYKVFKYIKGDIPEMVWQESLKREMENNTGFFPATDKNLDKYGELMLREIPKIDILGSILNLENQFLKETENSKTIRFGDLDSYLHKIPWTKALEGKKVLVIYPFVESIKMQYAKRELIFKNKDVLPPFELLTYKPVQSIAGNYENLPFANWFEALDFMKDEIAQIDFDIAIIGCGAYGLPLAAFVKDLGKKSIHLGGSTQILFGIIGKRWEEEFDMSPYVNEHWVRPSENEKPKNFKNVEDGCYW